MVEQNTSLTRILTFSLTRIAKRLTREEQAAQD